VKPELLISADNLVKNAQALKDTVGDFYCVLKCDAYGHGATRCASALHSAGMKRFAVFSLAEALEIKSFVGDSDILILGRTPSRYASALKENRFIQTVFSEEYASELKPFSNGLRAHIKLDSGMNRSGFKTEPEIIKKAFSGFRGEIEGVYTHFHSADCDSLEGAEKQLVEFTAYATELEAILSKKLTKHAAASAAALRMKRARLDICRIGLALYGCLPDNCEAKRELLPVMTLRAPVISVREVEKGENIGYGCDNTAKKRMTVATVAVGYANGLPRSAMRLFRPAVNGKRVDIAGRICMDRCMLDVTDVDGVKPYCEVELFGASVSVTELAEAEGTIPYETLTRVGKMNR